MINDNILTLRQFCGGSLKIFELIDGLGGPSRSLNMRNVKNIGFLNQVSAYNSVPVSLREKSIT